MNEIITLPIEIQISLASGYAAYATAYTGIRSHHRTIDTILITMLFSLISIIISSTLVGSEKVQSYIPNSLFPVFVGFSSFFSAVAFGFIFRKYLRTAIRVMFRKIGFSWSDDDPNTLISLSTSTSHYVTQISVQLEDGTWMSCCDTSRFINSPFGPCMIGPSGDVAIYLTHETNLENDDKELKSVIDKNYGDRITYIPAERIKIINIRHLPK